MLRKEEMDKCKKTKQQTESETPGATDMNMKKTYENPGVRPSGRTRADHWPLTNRLSEESEQDQQKTAKCPGGLSKLSRQTEKQRNGRRPF